jgi:hypothetical protein
VKEGLVAEDSFEGCDPPAGIRKVDTGWRTLAHNEVASISREALEHQARWCRDLLELGYANLLASQKCTVPNMSGNYANCFKTCSQGNLLMLERDTGLA